MILKGFVSVVNTHRDEAHVSDQLSVDCIKC